MGGLSIFDVRVISSDDVTAWAESFIVVLVEPAAAEEEEEEEEGEEEEEEYSNYQSILRTSYFINI